MHSSAATSGWAPSCRRLRWTSKKCSRCTTPCSLACLDWQLTCKQCKYKVERYNNLGVHALIVECRHQLLKFRLNLYKLREERDMKPETFSHLVSSILYEKRCVYLFSPMLSLLLIYCHRFGPYFVEPIVAGLDPDTGKPWISAMDLIGAEVGRGCLG